MLCRDFKNLYTGKNSYNNQPLYQLQSIYLYLMVFDILIDVILNARKSLSKNGRPVTFWIEKMDYDYSLLFIGFNAHNSKIAFYQRIAASTDIFN